MSRPLILSPRRGNACLQLLVALLLLLARVRVARGNGVNISTVLRGVPSLSSFAQLLSATAIPAELASRSSITLLAVPNHFFLSSLISRLGPSLPDLLRHHILLEYLTEPDLRRLPPSGRLVATLYQTTGRAPSDYGSLNLTASLAISPAPSPFSPSNATLLSQLAAFPYNLSVISVDAFLIPYGFNLPASETEPPATAAAAPAVNITSVLLDAQDFNVAASMLEASGVAAEFEGYEHGVGITVFVPTDLAFATSNHNSKLRSLPADKKALVLKFHALHSYYPLGSLQSIVNPVQPTVATEDTEAGLYTLNITRVNGSVAIGTGLIQAAITRTVFDQNPVAIFAVSNVLLPKEIFGRNGDSEMRKAAPPAVELSGAGPDVAAPPAMGPGADGRGSLISAGKGHNVGFFGLIWLMGSMYLCQGGMGFGAS